MKICAAQTKPVKGDIHTNMDSHIRFIDLAHSLGADCIIFPELSLTGYEPTLSKELALDQADSRLDDFQNISNAGRITIGIGIPSKHKSGICISMLLFQPYKARRMYSKKYLHPDEEKFFIPGQNFTRLWVNKTHIAPAICYEISIPEHAERAFNSGAELYIASVAKFINGIDKALKRLSGIAGKYSMTVIMSNCIGRSDGGECAGNTSVWNHEGVLVGQLNNKNEGLLIFDTDTQNVIEKII